MSFCRHCGKEILDMAVICPACGCPARPQNNGRQAVDNSINAGLVVLSVLIPLFGFIYWPLKAKTQPKCAEACGIAALISFAAGLCILALAGI